MTVNGEVVTVMGSRADPDSDVIEVDGHRLREAQVPTTIVMHKPVRVVTTLEDPEGRETVADLVRNEPFRFLPVGRLDYHTEGLLLLTTDGALTNRLLHPKYHVPKIYMVKVRGIVRPSALDQLRDGVQLEDGLTRPAMVEHRGQGSEHTWLELVVTEGRNRLVRRMCDAIGHVALRVVRIEMGTIKLEGLKPGQYRYLEGAEINALYQVAKMSDTPAQPERAEQTYYQAIGESRRGRGPMPGQDILPDGFLAKNTRKNRVANRAGMERAHQRREMMPPREEGEDAGRSGGHSQDRPRFRRFDEGIRHEGPRQEGRSGPRPPQRSEGEPREDRYAHRQGQSFTRERSENRDAPRREGHQRSEGPRGGYQRNDRGEGPRGGYQRNDRGEGQNQGRGYQQNDRSEGQSRSYGRNERSEGQNRSYGRNDRSEGQNQGYGRNHRGLAPQDGPDRNEGERSRGGRQDRSEGRSPDGPRARRGDEGSASARFGARNQTRPRREAPKRADHEHDDGDGWDAGGTHPNKKRRFEGPRGRQVTAKPRTAPRPPQGSARPAAPTPKPQSDGDFVDTKANSKSPRPRTDPKKKKSKKGKGKVKARGKAKKKARK